MPSSSLLKAASTPSEPAPSCAVVAGFLTGGFGDGFAVAAGVWLSVDTALRFVFVVRGRSLVVDVFEFWATTTPHVNAKVRSKLIALIIGKLLTRITRIENGLFTTECRFVIFAPKSRGRAGRKSRTLMDQLPGRSALYARR